jgi:DNA mismatch endonuclease, patch repair protein
VIPGLRCRADAVFATARVALFVDGCFWHSCPTHGVVPRANKPWWEEKLARTTARDRRNDRILAAAGWTVIRVWEHEDARVAADRVERLVRAGKAVATAQRA